MSIISSIRKIISPARITGSTGTTGSPVTIGGVGSITTNTGTYTYNPSTGTLMTPQGGMSVPTQESASSNIVSRRGGGGGSSGGGSSSGGGTSPSEPVNLQEAITKVTKTNPIITQAQLRQNQARQNQARNVLTQQRKIEYSPQVQAVRENKRQLELAKQEAKKLGVVIDTPAKLIGFINRFNKGYYEQSQTVTQDTFNTGNIQQIDISAPALINKKGEIYNSKLNRYMSDSPGGSKATATMRPPTIEEQEKIDLTKQDFKNFKEKLISTSPFGDQRLQLGNVLGISQTSYDEYGNKLPTLTNEPVQQQGVLALNLPTIAFFGFSSPRPPVPSILSRTNIAAVGAIERKGLYSKINIGSAASRGEKVTYGISKTLVQNEGEVSKAVGMGFTFKMKNGVTFPNLKRVISFEKVEPFVDLSVGKQLGGASLSRNVGTIGYTGEVKFPLGNDFLTATSKMARNINEKIPFGEGGLVKNKAGDTFVFASRQVSGETPYYEVIGGEPTAIRFYKKGGIKYVVKNPNIKMKIYEITPEAETTTNILQPANIKKTPLSLTFAETKVVTSSLVNPLNKGTIEKVIPLNPVQKVAPGLSSSLYEREASIQPSIYTGQGTYERTQGGLVPQMASSNDLLVPPMSSSKNIDLLGYSIKTGEKVKEGVGFKILLRDTQQELDQKTNQKLKQDFLSQTRQADMLLDQMKLDQKLEQKVSLKIQEAQKQKQQQKFKLSQMQFQQMRQPPPEKIKPPVPPVLDLPSSGKGLFSKGTVSSSFGFYVKKKGEDIFKEGFKTLSEAEKAFGKEIFGTLRAGGGITKEGKKIRTNIPGLVPSKRDAFRLVQPRSKRLSARSEVMDIQYFKKRKGRK